MANVSPSQRELDVLKVLWERGEFRVRDVHQAMFRQENCAFSTVQTLLCIMADKGLVAVRHEGRMLVYAPLYTREQLSSHFLHRVFDGALDKLAPNGTTVARRQEWDFTVSDLETAPCHN